MPNVTICREAYHWCYGGVNSWHLKLFSGLPYQAPRLFSSGPRTKVKVDKHSLKMHWYNTVSITHSKIKVESAANHVPALSSIGAGWLNKALLQLTTHKKPGGIELTIIEVEERFSTDFCTTKTVNLQKSTVQGRITSIVLNTLEALVLSNCPVLFVYPASSHYKFMWD